VEYEAEDGIKWRGARISGFVRAGKQDRRNEMKICPIAIVAGCEKCPFFKVCPAKGALGGYQQPPAVKAKPAARKRRAKPKAGSKIT
jgi:hypothetical protein